MPDHNLLDAALLVNEEWRPVVGYEGLYEVSNLARVRRSPHSPRTSSQVIPGKILRQDFNLPNRRYQASLCRNGEVRKFYVHTLVALAFIGPRPDGAEINHINTDKTDNRPTNLEYLTKPEHDLHTTACGLRATGDRHGSRTRPDRIPKGEANPQAKLTEDLVRAIRADLAAGLIYRVIAGRYGVDKSTIGLIKRGARWRHVQ